MFHISRCCNKHLEIYEDVVFVGNINSQFTHEKNDFVERSKILAGYKSEKQLCGIIKIII